MSRISYFSSLFALCVLLINVAPLSQANEQASPLLVSEAYFRLMPPGRSMSAAYMNLENTSGESQTLIGLRSDSAANVELHEHSHVNGMMRMRKVDQLNIADGESVTLEPGGYHLMLFGLQAGLGLDDTIDIELQLASGQSVLVNFKARSLK